nr:MAG TPA: putative arylamine n-acetyl transferase [Caudoviricetes sp.]
MNSAFLHDLSEFGFRCQSVIGRYDRYVIRQ